MKIISELFTLKLVWVFFNSVELKRRYFEEMLVTKQSLGAIDNQSMVKKSMAIVNWLLIYFQRNSYRFGTTWEWLNDDIIYVSFHALLKSENSSSLTHFRSTYIHQMFLSIFWRILQKGLVICWTYITFIPKNRSSFLAVNSIFWYKEWYKLIPKSPQLNVNTMKYISFFTFLFGNDADLMK